MIKCPNCSAELQYDVEQKQVTCEYCGSTFNPEELGEKHNSAKEEKVERVNEQNEIVEAKAFSCSQCGAQLMTFDDTAVTFCNYCGSSAVLESRMDYITPEYVIPFEISKEVAIEKYKKKLSKAIFAPKEMKNDMEITKFRGIYIPYVVHKFTKGGDSVNKGSKHYKTVGNYDYYYDYSITSDIDLDIEGFSYDLVSNFYDEYSHAISPFDNTKKKDFNLSYMSGFYADCKDVDDKTYVNEAIEEAQKASAQKLLQDPVYINHGCYSPKANIVLEKTKTAMYPVYFLSFKDKSQKRISYAVVNGQTGKTAIDIPVDVKKYVLATLLIAIPLFILFNFLLFLLPSTLLSLSLLFSFITMIVIGSKSKKLKKREQYLDDIGYMSKHNEKKEKVKSGFRAMWKQLVAFLFAGLVLLANPTEDSVFYTAALLNLVVIMWGYIDLIKIHNKLTTRKLPQFNKRGGDER